jgi:hypothetical protein
MSCLSSRRLMLKLLAGAPAAALFAAAGAADAQGAAATCETPEDDGLPQALGFVGMSPHADRACRNCSFWTADARGECGACEMMHRSTPAVAFCNSHAPR